MRIKATNASSHHGASLSNAQRIAAVGDSDTLPLKKLLVAGVARNVGKTIKDEILRLQFVLQSFHNVQWLIIESDSEDETVSQLKELESEIFQFRFLSLGILRTTMPSRTQRLAYCRNKYLEELNWSPHYRDVDYLIVLDLDGVNSLLTEEGFISCWKKDDWDVCCANQRGPYFDVWALRHSIWSPNDCWSQFNFFIRNNLKREDALLAAVYAKMITISEDSDWIEVESAFGGLAVYRRAALGGAKYSGLGAHGEEICEHVTFHAALRSEGRRILINPKLINSSYTEHTRHLRRSKMSDIKRALHRPIRNLPFFRNSCF